MDRCGAPGSTPLDRTTRRALLRVALTALSGHGLTVGSVRAYVEALGATVDMIAHVGDLDVALDVPGAA